MSDPRRARNHFDHATRAVGVLNVETGLSQDGAERLGRNAQLLVLTDRHCPLAGGFGGLGGLLVQDVSDADLVSSFFKQASVDTLRITAHRDEPGWSGRERGVVAESQYEDAMWIKALRNRMSELADGIHVRQVGHGIAHAEHQIGLALGIEMSSETPEIVPCNADRQFSRVLAQLNPIIKTSRIA